MRHNRVYIIFSLFIFTKCNYSALNFSSLFIMPSECNCSKIIEWYDDIDEYTNIFAGIGCVIDNPKAYYLRILVDIVAWYFRFSKGENKSRDYKIYYGTELGVTFYPLRRKRVISFCLELNFNILSWLLYFPYAFITTSCMHDRLVTLLLAGILNSSIFMCNFSLLKKHLKIHTIDILQIAYLFLLPNRYSFNYIKIIKERYIFTTQDGSRKKQRIYTQTHYRFGKHIKRHFPVTYISDDYNFDNIFKAVAITILNALLPCISIII